MAGDGGRQDGLEVLLSALANEGFTFVSWTSNGEVISEASDYSFTMPAQDVTLFVL